MAQNNAPSPETAPQTGQPTQPDPALRRLDRLVGTWEIKGRTLGAAEDNIRGRVMIEWLAGGWRADGGQAETAGNTYDATMIRVESKR